MGARRSHYSQLVQPSFKFLSPTPAPVTQYLHFTLAKPYIQPNGLPKPIHVKNCAS